MSKSEKIRELAAQGIAIADIARQLGIRYQHVRNVLIDSDLYHSGLLSRPQGNVSSARKKRETVMKPPLSVSRLVEAGFEQIGDWQLNVDGGLMAGFEPRREEGVYAFAQNDVVQYVGVATMGLAKRLYFYARPGKTQRTSLRLNQLMRSELSVGRKIAVLVASPEYSAWNGLPVHGAAGLELGLIKTFDLPWNKRSAG